MRLFLTVLSSLAIIITATGLTSCTGYQLGGSKPSALKDIDSIYVVIADNKTQEIKLAPQFTNRLITFINNDGTYQVSSLSQSQATLSVVIEKVDYDEFRSSRFDTLLAEELTATIFTTWKLTNPQNEILLQGKSSGKTRFFVEDNQRLARENSLYDAIDNLSRTITSRISNGF